MADSCSHFAFCSLVVRSPVVSGPAFAAYCILPTVFLAEPFALFALR